MEFEVLQHDLQVRRNQMARIHVPINRESDAHDSRRREVTCEHNPKAAAAKRWCGLEIFAEFYFAFIVVVMAEDGTEIEIGRKDESTIGQCFFNPTFLSDEEVIEGVASPTMATLVAQERTKRPNMKWLLPNGIKLTSVSSLMIFDPETDTIYQDTDS